MAKPLSISTLLLTIPSLLLCHPVNSTPLNLPTTILPRAATPPPALPQRATPSDLRYQPALDFDTDGCYNVPAISASGTVAQGLPHNFVGYNANCRDLSDLLNNNVYSRQRCNSGWCVYIYDYYFEKDVATQYFLDVGGHTHDWEHVAVWVRNNGSVEYVGTSRHGEYEIRAAKDVRFEGDHPKVVYHKDGGSTHCFRFADEGDEVVENHLGVWFRGPLVGYNGFPSVEVRERLHGWNFGKADVALTNVSFPGQIGRAKPDGVGKFDVYLDEGSPGVLE